MNATLDDITSSETTRKPPIIKAVVSVLLCCTVAPPGPVMRLFFGGVAAKHEDAPFRDRGRLAPVDMGGLIEARFTGI